MASDTALPSAAATTLLGVFARYWQPGEVKTRLARRIGSQSAARLHRHFVDTTLLRLTGIGATQRLVISPGDAQPRVAIECPAASGWRISGQSDGDLGARMGDFFARALLEADRVLLVGADSPDLPREWVGEALAQLERVPVVLGPAHDGGYYLVGINARHGEKIDLHVMFDGVPWGTSRVLPLTIDRLKTGGIGYHLLPTWYDVDEWEDLVALQQRLMQRDGALDEPLTALLAAVLAESARIHADATR
jgi:rSAM/selenodomain-associated transferase 1